MFSFHSLTVFSTLTSFKTRLGDLLDSPYWSPNTKLGCLVEIKIQSGEELNKLLDALAKDIVDANIFFRLITGLSASIKDYPTEFAQSNTFWSLTMQALKEAYLTRLCRVFEQNCDTLNLYNLLDTIKANLHFFEEPHFRERMKDNAFVNSLAEDARIPALKELLTDIEYASIRNPIVLKLIKWRNNFHAHIGAKVPLGKAGSLKSLRIDKDEINELLDQCFVILNRYMRLYKATSWSRQIIGHDDYLSLLKFLHLGVESYEADIQREIDSDNSGDSPPSA